MWRWMTRNRSSTIGAAAAVVATAMLVGGVLSASPVLGAVGFAATVGGSPGRPGA